MVLIQVLGAGLLTATSSVGAAVSPAPAFTVPRITAPVIALVGRAQASLSDPAAPRYRRSWTMKPAAPVSAHRDDEDGPIILTEKGPLRCRGHRFNADNVYQVEPESHEPHAHEAAPATALRAPAK